LIISVDFSVIYLISLVIDVFLDHAFDNTGLDLDFSLRLRLNNLNFRHRFLDRIGLDSHLTDRRLWLFLIHDLLYVLDHRLNRSLWLCLLGFFI
jgi:hypothetical protein